MNKTTNINIHENQNALSDVYIHITLNKNLSDSSRYVQTLINYFLRYFNMMIGSKTNINYNIIDVKDFTIKIPIYVYTQDDAQLKPLELITKRINTIKSFFRDFNWDNTNKMLHWVIRALRTIDIDITNLLQISVHIDEESVLDNINGLSTLAVKTQFDKLNSSIEISPPTIEDITFSHVELSDKSKIIYIEDPYANDYGLYVNLSIPYEEMGMSYNSLHLFEHLATKCWKKCKQLDVTELNGSTYPNGISYIYTIHSSRDSLMTHLNATVQWFFTSRLPNFWDNIRDDVDLETQRTISETRTERSLTMFGRSDFKAYTKSYDLKIFEYWSNKPFSILVISPKKVSIDENKLNELCKKYPLRKIEKPRNPTFKNIPSDILIVKSIEKCYNLKCDTKDIVKRFMENDFDEHCYFGIDCACYRLNEKLNSLNCVLYPLLFLNRYISEKDVERFIKSHIFPRGVGLYKNTNCELMYNDVVELGLDDIDTEE